MRGAVQRAGFCHAAVMSGCCGEREETNKHQLLPQYPPPPNICAQTLGTMVPVTDTTRSVRAIGRALVRVRECARTHRNKNSSLSRESAREIRTLGSEPRAQTVGEIPASLSLSSSLFVSLSL